VNQQPSTSEQPDNILSLAQSWFRDGVQRMGQAQTGKASTTQPPDRALYERVKRIANEILQENGGIYPQSE